MQDHAPAGAHRARAIEEQIAVTTRHLKEARALHSERALQLVDDPDSQTLLDELTTLEAEIQRHENNVQRFQTARQALGDKLTAEAQESLRSARQEAADRAKAQATERVVLARKIDATIAKLREQLDALEDADTSLHRSTYEALRDITGERAWATFDLSAWTRLSTVAQPLKAVLADRSFRELKIEPHAVLSADRLSAKIDRVRAKAGEA